MNRLPTSIDLGSLGANLAHDGFTDHEDDIAEIVALATQAGSTLASLAVLADRLAPPAARARAFAKVARHWPNYQATLAEQQRRFDDAFGEMLERWRENEQRLAMAQH